MKLLNEIISVTRVEPQPQTQVTQSKRASRWFDVCPECHQHPCICVGGTDTEHFEDEECHGCPECGGTGMDEENEELCSRCDGTGDRLDDDPDEKDEFRFREPCPSCGGSGKEYDDETCLTCFGSGVARDDRDEENEETETALGKYGQQGMAGRAVDVDPDSELEDNTGLDDESDYTHDNPGGDADTAEPQEAEDPDRQGLIRKINNAHLVYKRQIEDGTYEELWVYNSNNDVKGTFDIRKAIISGTDIPVGKTESEDGSQTYEVWTSGNVEMVMVKGLPN